MVNQQLLDYIKKELARGVSENALRNVLMEHGWPEFKIHEAFEESKKAKPEEPAEKVSEEKPEEAKPETAEEAKHNILESFKILATKKLFIIIIAVIILGAIASFLIPTLSEEEEIAISFSSAARDYAKEICTQYCNSNLCGLVNNPGFTHPELEGKSCEDAGFPCLHPSGEPKC